MVWLRSLQCSPALHAAPSLTPSFLFAARSQDRQRAPFLTVLQSQIVLRYAHLVGNGNISGGMFMILWYSSRSLPLPSSTPALPYVGPDGAAISAWVTWHSSFTAPLPSGGQLRTRATHCLKSCRRYLRRSGTSARISDVVEQLAVAPASIVAVDSPAQSWLLSLSAQQPRPSHSANTAAPESWTTGLAVLLPKAGEDPALFHGRRDTWLQPLGLKTFTHTMQPDCAASSSSTVVVVPGRRLTSSAVVGAVPCAYPDLPPFSLDFLLEHTITVRQYARSPASAASPNISPRATAYVPPDPQAATQLERVQKWRLERLLSPTELDVVFAIGSFSKSIRAWRKRTRSSHAPPLYVLRRAYSALRLHTPCVSASGHLWSVRDCAPLDARQLCEVLDTTSAASDLQAMVTDSTLSAYRLRCLCGQATHGGVMRRIIRRLHSLASARHPWPASPTLGLLGAGIGFSGLQAVAALGSSTASILFAADACPRAAPAGRQLLSRRGHEPTWFARAEAPALASAEWHVTMEVITLRCAPVSWANAYYPRGVEGALHELWAVCAGVRARRPIAILYETTAGLWKRPDLRYRLERLLLAALPEYQWEGAKLSPHRHANSRWSRDRVFYYAYLRRPRSRRQSRRLS